MELLPSNDLLVQTKGCVFIVSPPRTGTKSVCKMLMILGYRVFHCSSIRFTTQLENKQYNAFADTPIYCPSVFSKLLDPSNKFIYIERSADNWLKSFENMRLHFAYMDYMQRSVNDMKPVHKMDRFCLSEFFENAEYESKLAKDKFNKHRDMVHQIIPTEQLLDYNFSNGWSTLCSFLDKEVPDAGIPHLNMSTMFEKIN